MRKLMALLLCFLLLILSTSASAISSKRSKYSLLADKALKMAVNSYLVMSSWDENAPYYLTDTKLIDFFEANELEQIADDYKQEDDDGFFDIPVEVVDEFISEYFDYDTWYLHANYPAKEKNGKLIYVVNYILGAKPPKYTLLNITNNKDKLHIKFDLDFEDYYLPQYTGTLTLKIEDEDKFKYISNEVKISKKAAFISDKPSGKLTDYINTLGVANTDKDFQGLMIAFAEPIQPASPLYIKPDKIRTLWLHQEKKKVVVTEIPDALLFFLGDELWWSYFLHSVYTSSSHNKYFHSNYGGRNVFSHYSVFKNIFKLICNKAPNDTGWNDTKILNYNNEEVYGNYKTLVHQPTFINENGLSLLEYHYSTGGGSLKFMTEEIYNFKIEKNLSKPYSIYDSLSQNQRQIVDAAVKKNNSENENSNHYEDEFLLQGLYSKPEYLFPKYINGDVNLILGTKYEYNHMGNGSHSEYFINEINTGISEVEGIFNKKSLPISWNKINKAYPKAIDAIFSEDNSLLVVKEPNQLRIVIDPLSNLTKVVLSLDIAEDNRIVHVDTINSDKALQMKKSLKIK